MDLGKAFSFAFDDEQWVSSILICGLLILVPILGIFVLIGYMLETARNVAMNSPRPLPKWDNFGEKLSLGFGGFVIGLGYALPIIILAMVLLCGTAGLGGIMRSERAMANVFGGSFFCLMPIIALLGIMLQPVVLAAYARYVQTGSLGAAFRIGEVLSIVRADLSGWLVMFLLYLLCSLVGSLGGMVIIGFLFTLPYSQAVFGHLLGQKIAQMREATGYEGGLTPPVTRL